MNRTIAKVLTVILGVATCICTMSNTVSASPYYTGVAPIDSYPLGKSYGEWAAEWQKWIATIPTKDPSAKVTPYHPFFGGPCEVGQHGNVWFLAGVMGGSTKTVDRTCTVPKNTALFLPLVNIGYAAFLNDLPLETRLLDYVRTQSLCIDRTVTPNSIIGMGKGTVKISVTIDDVAVNNPQNYYEQSSFYELQLPVDNFYGIQSTNPSPVDPVKTPYAYERYLSPGADSGYYLFLNPLKPGHHSIELNAEWTCGKDPDGNDMVNNQNVNFDINVTQH